MKRHINRIHIIGGNGQMGQWLTSFFRTQNIDITISGKNQEDINAIENADVVILSVPISEVINVAQQITKLCKHDVLIVDISSIKHHHAELTNTRTHPVLSLHMLFGPNVTSLSEQYIVILPGPQNQKSKEFKQLFKDNGANLVKMSAEEHDIFMGYIQNLTHFINIALVQTLLRNDIFDKPFRTPVFTSQLATAERVLSQSPSLLTEIQLANAYGKKIIRQFLRDSHLLLEHIEQSEKEEVVHEIDIIHHALKQYKQPEDVIKPSDKLL